MASTINTNVVSLNAQRNLSGSQSTLATSMQRLSSGLRVNSAKDDAAGLAIAERMNTQVKGLTVASRNANDGISLAQTAEGALGKVGDMLQRMRELAVQSSNATNSKTDRESLQSEVKQLSEEIDRVAKTTSFNGTKVLDGSFGGAVFQVGANSGDNITIGGLANTTGKGLAKVAYGTTSGSVTSSSISSGGATGNFDAKIASGTFSITVSGSTAVDLGEIKAASSADELTAFLSKDSAGATTIDIRSSAVTSGGTAQTVTLSGFSAANSGFSVTTTTAAAGTATTGIDNVSVGTQADAWTAIKKIDSAIDQVNSSRADLGALQSRFENAIGNIESQNENISASRGRIVDADFAKETANLSRAQILQQAGTAMVAQANQLPQSVLSLLKG
ncbi:flagellin [Xylophilus sp. Leaf220]|nr:flagellin [Xylophilus sp. Leaf220]KQM69705.1 flagellin [Xylophilus sp. Leaf220]